MNKKQRKKITRKTTKSYNIYEPMKIKCYFKNLPISKSKIGNGDYRFDIKRKWGYQNNRYNMKSIFCDTDFHIKHNHKLDNLITIKL